MLLNVLLVYHFEQCTHMVTQVKAGSVVVSMPIHQAVDRDSIPTEGY